MVVMVVVERRQRFAKRRRDEAVVLREREGHPGAGVLIYVSLLLWCTPSPLFI